MASLLEQFSLSEAPAPEERTGRPTLSLDQFQRQSAPEPEFTLSDEFTAGLSQGTDSLQMSLHGVSRMMGREFGIKPLENLGQSGIDRNVEQMQAAPPPSVASIAEIEDTGDFFKWAASGLGQAIPSLATTIAGGGVGGAIVKKSLENGMRRTMMNQLSRKMQAQAGVSATVADATAKRAVYSDVANKMIIEGTTRGSRNTALLASARQKGAIGGATLAGAAPIVGQTDIELQEAGVTGGKSALSALMAGTAGGALEALPALRLLDKLFPGVDAQVSKSFVKDLAVGLGQQAALEGSTEAAQEMIQIAALAFHDPTFDPYSDENKMRALDAFAIGALVGGVTGGVAQIAGEGQTRVAESASRMAARPKLPEIPEFDVTEGGETFADPDFVPADNTVYEEVRDRTQKMAAATLNPIMNRVRESGNAAIGSLRAAFGTAMDGEIGNTARQIGEAHNEFVTEHKELLNRTTQYAKDSVRKVSEAASRISDPVAREQFVSAQLDKVKTEVDRVAAILKKNAATQEQATAQRIDDINIEDDGVTQDIPEANPTQFVFGKNNTGGRDTKVDLFNPPGGEVEGFSTRKAARNLLSKLRKQFPSADDSVFAINQQQDGAYVVELNDPANAELLMEDDRISRGVERARLSARKHQNGRRKVKLKTGTTIDFPTMVYAARDLTDVTTYNQGVDAAVARLMERDQVDAQGAQAILSRFRRQRDRKLPKPNSENENDFDALNPIAKKAINERMNDQLDAEGLTAPDAETRQARQARRAELLADELDDLDANPNELRNIGRERMGDEAEFIEAGDGRNLESEADQAAASASRRPINKNFRPTVKEFENQNPTKVYAPGTDKDTVRALQGVLDFVQKRLGLKTDTRIINKEGANNMVRRGHAHASIAREMASAGLGRIVGDTIDGVDYAYILVDTNSPPAVQATVLMHELGHLVYRETWSDLTPEAQAKLRAAFVDATKGETKSTVRGREEFIPDEAEFNEWMADQLVANANTQPASKNPVQQFLNTVGTKLRELFAFLKKNPRFREANQTYTDFINAVANRARGIGSPHFKEDAQPEGFTLPPLNVDDISITIPKTIPKDALDGILQKYENRYPALVKKATLLRNWVVNAYSVAAAPSQSTMLEIAKRVPAAKKLVQIFGREGHGLAKRSQNYHQRINLMKGQFSKRYTDIVKDFSDAEKAVLLSALRAADGNPDADLSNVKGAREMRKLFDDMHSYLRDSAGLPMGKVANYFPRQFSREKLIDNREEIIDHLMKRRNMKRGAAQSFYNSLISREAEESAALLELENDPLATQAPAFGNMRSRTAQGKFFDKYLEDNLDGVTANYVNAAVKRGEFNRFLGMDSKGQKGWKPRGKFDAILKTAEAQKATEADLKFMKQYVDANLGMLGRDFDRALPGARPVMAAMVAYQNMRVLAFTVFASLPDMVGPAIRTGDMAGAFKTTMREIKNIASNKSELNELARAYGIVNDQMVDHIFTEYVDNHYMPAGLRKWNDAFFKYTGLEGYTNFTRRMALAVGKDYIKNQARITREGATEKERLNAEAALAELGISAKRVEEWVSNGEPTWSGAADKNKTNQAIAESLVQFVDESIMRPNASQRPLMASHPAAMLVFHLKGYMYSLYDIVIKRMAHNFTKANDAAQILAAVAPAILMMALTAVGLELREFVQYNLAGKAGRTDRMDGWDYTWTLVERTGLLGPAQLAFDFSGADRMGMTGLAAVGGPTLGQFSELLTRPPSQTVPKAIPGIGQIPWARDGLREFTPL